MANKASDKKKPASPMPVSERAKQFSPFSALKGLSEALEKKEHTPVPRKSLSDEQAEAINRTLLAIQRGDVATAVRYDGEMQEYVQMTGIVSDVDLIARLLHIGSYAIPFSELADLIAEERGEPS